MVNGIIKLKDEDVREALRLIREQYKAHAALHNAEEQTKLFEQQLFAVYEVPDGYVLRNWTTGFEPAEVVNG